MNTTTYPVRARTRPVVCENVSSCFNVARKSRTTHPFLTVFRSDACGVTTVEERRRLHHTPRSKPGGRFFGEAEAFALPCLCAVSQRARSTKKANEQKKRFADRPKSNDRSSSGCNRHSGAFAETKIVRRYRFHDVLNSHNSHLTLTDRMEQ